MTIREALIKTASDLKISGIKTSSLDASLLLSSVLNISKEKLYTIEADTLSDENLDAFFLLINRRKNGECTAYILGKKEFWGLELTVNNSVLVPRPETETLVEAALEKIKNEKGKEKKEGDVSGIRVLELCTGSGAVAIALKSEMPHLEVHATDISSDALKVAKLNAASLLGINQINFYSGDLFLALPSAPFLPFTFSLIICNPPYVPTDEINTLSAEVKNEPLLALDGGKTGLDIIKRIIYDAPCYLEKNGRILMEADPRQMKEIKIMLEKRGFRRIIIYKDFSGDERVIEGVYE